MGRSSIFRSALHRAALLAVTVCGLAACSDKIVAPGEIVIPGPGVLYPLVLETFDGSGEAVHPDPVETPAGWGAAETFLVATPYPGGNSKFENPSYYEGGSPIDWHPPHGVVNPIALPGANAYLSDPDQLYDPVTNQIWLYYRRVTDKNEIWLIRSSDGVHWDTPTNVVSVPNHEAVSQTVVKRGVKDWMMWAVNSGASGCGAPSTNVELRKSTDGVHWSDPSKVEMPGVAKGESPWHLDVTWVAERHEFWALYNAKQSGSCTTEVLRLARSMDGVHWTTMPEPLLTKGAIPEFADVVYRASMVYNAASDRVTLWYSGARLRGQADSAAGSYAWRVAMQEMSRATMFGIAGGNVQQVTTGDMAQTANRVRMSREVPLRSRVPLTNETAP